MNNITPYQICNIYDICILFLISVFLFPKVLKQKKISKSLFTICILLIIFIIADIFYSFLNNSNKDYPSIYYKITTFIYFIIQPFVFLYFIDFLLIYFNYKKFLKPVFFICLFFLVVYVVFMILTPFKGLYYYYDVNNVYYRGEYHFVSVLINGVFLFVGFILVFVNKRKMQFVEFFSVMMFFVFPIVTEFIQLKYPNLDIIGTGLTIPIIIIFCNLHKKLENRLKLTNSYAKTKQQELESLQKKTIIGLSDVVENRGLETGNHVERITKIVIALANKCLENCVYTQIIDDDYIRRLQQVVPLHDIGKIVVPDSLLKKESSFTQTEFETMKSHVTEGEKIVINILSYENDKYQVRLAKNLVKYHHEKWNGTGYPEGLQKEQIPLSARLMAIADVFDALVAKRIYKDSSWPVDKAFEYIESQANIAFDPLLTQQFMLIKEEVARIFQ